MFDIFNSSLLWVFLTFRKFLLVKFCRIKSQICLIIFCSLKNNCAQKEWRMLKTFKEARTAKSYRELLIFPYRFNPGTFRPHRIPACGPWRRTPGRAAGESPFGRSSPSVYRSNSYYTRIESLTCGTFVRIVEVRSKASLYGEELATTIVPRTLRKTIFSPERFSLDCPVIFSPLARRYFQT